jgi:uncharacterized protein YdgA (DUF945 family)
MKKLLWLLLLIVAISVAAPGLLGMQAEERYNAAVTQLQAAGYRVVDRTYARGWFTSSARLQLETPLPEGGKGDSEPPRLLAKTQVVHGPFLGDVDWPFGLARLDTEIWVGSVPLVVGEGKAPLRTLVSFLGSGRTVVEVPARQLAFPGGTLEVAPVDGQLVFGAGDVVARGQLAMPSLMLRADDGGVAELAGAALSVDLRRGPAGLPVGVWRFGLDRMVIEAPDEAKAFAADGVEISGSSEVRDGAMDLVANYRLRSARVDGKTYGPFDMRLAARQVAADAIARIQAAGEEAAATGATVEERSTALGVAMLANAEALFARDPSVALEQLAFDMPEGRVAASFEVRAVGLKVAELGSVEKVLQRLQGKAALRLPEVVLDALIRQQGRQQVAAQTEQSAEAEQPSAEEVEEAVAQYAAQQIETLVTQQLLVRDAGAVSVSAELRNGLLTVNGKSIPLAAFLQRPGARGH